jgi:hypothetical protein
MRGLYYDLVVDPATVVEKHAGITVTDIVAFFGIVSSAPAGTW